MTRFEKRALPMQSLSVLRVQGKNVIMLTTFVKYNSMCFFGINIQ